MKYPQLVSTRAVNAISDWLVSRLEQLGVEAPQIYTRLLLSLLQSSVQINDPIEFNSLEAFIGNRKGGSIRRYLQCDANTLKKLNAVHCLSEIVSSEQELTTIESLVDELWEKLNDIEKQLDYCNGDEINLVNNSVSSTTSVEKSEANKEDQTVETSHTNLPKNCKKNYHNHNNEKRTIVCRGRGDTDKSIELETDPKKRYFNAFPALSKEMEDSFRIWRRNSKSLTWPADRATIDASKTAVNSPNSLQSSCDLNSSKSAIKNDDIKVSKFEHLSNCSNHAINSSTGGGLKRKTKRRKSQSMSKGRAMPNTRKTAFNDNVINAMSSTGNSGTNRKSNRHRSPTQWDTDFEGYWEMGRDLIKEFFAKQGDRKQNQNQNRNRCNSANGACLIKKTVEDHHAKEKETQSNVENLSSSPLMPPVDISFCCDDSIDDDDTYKSIVELTADNAHNIASRSSPRRLYQRLALLDNVGGDIESSTENDVQADIMQLKAKFNCNIASLWQNSSDDENTINNDESSLWSAPSNLPWPHVAPIKENLKNFWTNFYNRQFDLPNQEQTDDHDQRINLENYQDMDVNASNSLSYNMASMPNIMAKTSSNNDFRSMPFNMGDSDMTDVAGITGRNQIYKKLDGRRTPVGVFLQDTIWSENLNGGKNTDTDESFYLKVWNSNRKLYNLDAIYEKKINDVGNDSKTNDPSFQFSAYGNSKWSEGINAGPNLLQVQRKQQQSGDTPLNICNRNEILNQSIDCTDASISTTTTSCSSSTLTLSSSGIFSVQTPSMQSSLQINENAKSLSEVYGINSPISDDCQIDTALENNEQTSPVSLSNHSSESSGFVEYSRIKSRSQALKEQQQRNYQAKFPRSKELLYPDDPNENLLTSERTHFQPIRAYADGYTFDVCSALEVIEYERSESGYLYFESEKYLEYTRKDIFMAEEENSSNIASAAPLYAGSNCEAAISQKRKKESNAETELVLKFRIRNHEMACQTDDEATIRSMYASSVQLAQEQQPQQHPLYLIFSSSVAEGFKIPATEIACSDAIEALNKAVAAAAKAASDQNQMHLDTPWLCINDLIDTSRNEHHHGSSMIWTAAQASPREEIGGIDEIEFCNESSLSSSCIYGNAAMDQQQQQQWSMRSNINEKNCQLNGGTVCPSQSINLGKGSSENNNSMQQNNADMHSLWGMCAACNNNKSAPANNLLRDELKLEADQIMSDLKNMQDLYIGCGNGGQHHADADANGDAETDDMDNYCSADYFWGRHGTEPRNLKHPYPIAMKASNEVHGRCEEYLVEGKTHDWNQNGLETTRQKQMQQQKVLEQVNKLIADLMRPEKANDTNVLADAAASAHRELGESLWPDDGEHNIWKQHNDSCNRYSNRNDGENQNVLPLRPSRYSVLCAEEKKFLAQLTWEHDHLAEIWTKNTPPLTTNSTPTQQQQKQQQQEQHQHPKQSLLSTPTSKPPVLLCSSADACANPGRGRNSDVEVSPSNLPSTDIVDTHDEEIKPTVESTENSKNVPVIASNINYKRIQQFLNSTGVSNGVTSAKLKLSNRKRRHSASQNYAIFYNNGLGGTTYSSNYKSNKNNSNNNNNAKVSDLNNYNFKRNPVSNNKAISNSNDEKSNAVEAAAAATATAEAPMANYTEDIDMVDHGLNDSDAYFLIKNNGDNMILPSPKQTIITCQYWTTIDPIMDTDVIECTEGTSFSCLVDKNNTILKHVTMLARPLTR